MPGRRRRDGEVPRVRRLVLPLLHLDALLGAAVVDVVHASRTPDLQPAVGEVILINLQTQRRRGSEKKKEFKFGIFQVTYCRMFETVRQEELKLYLYA